MLEIGSLVDGKYKILNKIGQGGMSIVYLAMNEKANKQWAIKEVRKDGVSEFDIVKQGLVVETNMLKRLSHPTLPSIVDIIEDEETFLIVMDYIEGNPLNAAIEEHGALPQEYVIEWGKQLCDVLGYLHSRKPSIIYRDMKPSNIMLKPDGNLILIDFGTAREFKEKSFEDTTCLGTVGYAAPEQFGGLGQTDVRTDIYCLGATLYHLVTGHNPCDPPYEMKPIREINQGLSGGLEKIITKCTQRNPNDRYQTCAELMYAFEHYEKIDDAYLKIQKKKMLVFLVFCMLTVSSLLIGISTKAAATAQAKDNYEEAMDMANKSSSELEKEEYYYEAIEIESNKEDAYLALIELYKDDSKFSLAEEEKLVSVIKNNTEVLLEDKDLYADICFEVGKLYWYYYDYGNSSKNRTVRTKASISWFADVVEYGGANSENYYMATVYEEIGIFYRDLPQKAIEGSEEGMYKDFFDKVSELLDMQGNGSSEIVKIELYELTRDGLMHYASKFKTEGITYDEIIKLYNKVEEGVANIDASTDKIREMKEYTQVLLEDTKKSIDLAYDK